MVDQPELTKDALLNVAAESYGLDDFGDDWFQGPMEVLLDAIKAEARLNAAGDFSAEKQFGHVLRDRLHAQMWFKRHPETVSYTHLTLPTTSRV